MLAIFVILGCVVGLTFGFILPLRWFAHLAGFEAGVICGVLVTLLTGMVTASLFGGWAESLFGTNVGVPIGVTAGTLFGSATMNCMVGFLGVLSLRTFHLLARFFGGS